jgi:hypothetical protein
MIGKLRPSTLWSRHRLVMLVSGLAGWVALISALHLHDRAAGGKGATELLQIGALPVT